MPRTAHRRPQPAAMRVEPFDAAKTPASALVRLAALLRARCPHDGRFDLAVPGVHLARFSARNTDLIHATPRPLVCIVAQGAKTVFLESETIVYDSGRLLVVAVDLPMAAQVSKASSGEPYLSLIVDLDPQRIAALTMRVFPQGLAKPAPEARGIYVSPSEPAILEAACRLLELTANPDDAALLAPLALEEILIRLLRGPAGPRLAEMGMADSKLQRIAQAIAFLREQFAQPVKIDTLAGLANMSLSSFHQHFKEVTAMSPLNYQKALRLQAARRLLLATQCDAGEAAQHVGYLSASQFSREYARFFGAPPTRDIAALRERGVSASEVAR
jgi:AraC-like DNA-binding protein